MSDKFTLKLNNGDTAVLHSASRDWVPIADLGLCTLWRANKAESERDAALDREMKLERERDEARTEVTTLRVKNKFLREKAGYFRDDIEDGLAGRDGSPRVFASPGSGSTPESPSLDAARADAARLRAALHRISLASQNSMSSKEECGRIARAALASAPSAEPTPRDMRVAEAVREACVEMADASDEASRRAAGDLRDLDLAAVVAEAVREACIDAFCVPFWEQRTPQAEGPTDFPESHSTGSPPARESPPRAGGSRRGGVDDEHQRSGGAEGGTGRTGGTQCAHRPRGDSRRAGDGA